MQVFRRVILPVLYLIVLAVIAVSLAWLAFAPSGESGSDDEFATGELVGTEVYVERGSIEASLEADGTIAIADPVTAKPGHDGTVNHIWVRPGMVVEEGDDLFQVAVEEAPDEAAVPDESEDGDDAPAPAPSRGARTTRSRRRLMEPWAPSTCRWATTSRRAPRP